MSPRVKLLCSSASLAVLGLFATQCTSFASEDAPARPAETASADASPAAEPAAALDPVDDADAGAPDGDAGNDCKGTEGPAGVRVGTFCIDATEVTVGHYMRFLASDAGAGTGAPAYCAFNIDFTPLSMPSPGSESYPINYIDWCDAWSYCAWAGKRLCGRVGGGAVPPIEHTNATTNQWHAACVGPSGTAFPYGATYDRMTCNGEDRTSPALLLPVASLASCVGGHAGLFDMSGNVSEWVDECSSAQGAGDTCWIRGGSKDFKDADLRCADQVGVARGARYSDIGFRCCSD